MRVDSGYENRVGGIMAARANKLSLVRLAGLALLVLLAISPDVFSKHLDQHELNSDQTPTLTTDDITAARLHAEREAQLHHDTVTDDEVILRYLYERAWKTYFALRKTRGKASSGRRTATVLGQEPGVRSVRYDRNRHLIRYELQSGAFGEVSFARLEQQDPF
jgi:hypothetical protein